jgi:hypothetical protein
MAMRLDPIVSDASVDIVSAGSVTVESKDARSMLSRERDVRDDVFSKCSVHL